MVSGIVTGLVSTRVGPGSAVEDMNERVAIHCYPDRQWSPWLWRLERLLQANHVPVERVCSSSPGFWEQIKHFTHYVHVWRQWDRSMQEARTILPVLEEDLGLKCYPNHKTCRMFDNKPQESLFMNAHKLPTPQSWVFWDRHYALDWATTAVLPLVFKLSGGASGSNVQLITSRDQLRKTIRRMFAGGFHPAHDLRHQGLLNRASEIVLRSLAKHKRQIFHQGVSHRLNVPNWKTHRHYAYFQEFVPGNDCDTRVLTVGDHAYGFVRRNRKNDFRASGSRNNEYRPESIDPRFVRMALDISKKFQFQTMAYDFLLDAHREPTIVEMGYAFSDRSVRYCPGYWNFALQWQAGPCWPQKLLLESFLGIDNLTVPEELAHFGGHTHFSIRDHVHS